MARTLGFLVLALALGVGAASNFKPSVDFSLSKDLGSGLSVDSLKGAVSVESQLSEDVSVGAQLDRDAANGLKGLFAKLSHSMGGGRVNADLNVGLEDNAVRGELGYEEGDNKLVADVDTNQENVVRSLRFSRQGDGWAFRPRFNLADGSVDLEAEAQVTDEANLRVNLEGGSSEVELKYSVDDSTRLTFNNKENLRIEVERDIDGDNTVRPSFNVNDKHFQLSWVRRLGDERTLTATVDPENSVDLELDGGDEDWSAKVSAPWSNPKDMDVSFGRKFQF